MKKMIFAALVAAVAVVVMSSCAGKAPEVVVDSSWTFTEKMSYDYQEECTYGFIEVHGEKRDASGEIVDTIYLPKTCVVKFLTPRFEEMSIFANAAEIALGSDIRIEKGEKRNINGFNVEYFTNIHTFKPTNHVSTEIHVQSSKVNLEDPATGMNVYSRDFTSNVGASAEFFVDENHNGEKMRESDRNWQYAKTLALTFRTSVSDHEMPTFKVAYPIWTPAI